MYTAIFLNSSADFYINLKPFRCQNATPPPPPRHPSEMVGLRPSFVTLALSLALSPWPCTLAAITVQKSGLSVPPEFASSKDAVKEIFSNAFSAYSKFAFGHDDLTRKTLP